ncbi:hypothetical protein [Pelagibius marinus]|uniref:hypothetical protein n=1 Tax=Pelagibius marinus TaxID=2762760 RepID=UPI001872EB5F|nr:hypothetical protein [Pelagibius marinus]
MIAFESTKLSGALARLAAAGAVLLLLAGGLQGEAAAQFKSPIPEPEYLLYGGANHSVFLGCLNCSRFDSRSVWNKLSPYGSEYDGDTIWNKISAYGSPYKPLSPWHPQSFDGPVVKDSEGRSYGTFTRNVHDEDRTKVESLLWLLNNYDYVIANLDEVRLRH